MRIRKEKVEFLKKKISTLLPDASVFLFGSRTLDNLKGGDIDILVLGNRHLTSQEKRVIRIAFYKKFGEQKIDIASFRKDKSSIFRDLAIQD